MLTRWQLMMARFRTFVGGFVVLMSAVGVSPAQNPLVASRTGRASENPMHVLDAGKWQQVDASVDRALKFLSDLQRQDGSFPGRADVQPAVTSLCVMSFFSRGHLPGKGRYGKTLTRAILYVLKNQSSSGFISANGVEPYNSQPGSWDQPRANSGYNHAISGIMLCEAYGAVQDEVNEQIRQAIIKALQMTRKYQISHKRNSQDLGGWRYMFPNMDIDSDLSVTSWQLMFLRAAKNAEFYVPDEHASDAMAFVKRCFDSGENAFRYSLSREEIRFTRGVNGAGILSLSLGGEHQSTMAQAAGQWILRQSFTRYNTNAGFFHDHYHYSVYYCSLGMFQLGGKYWRGFYPPVVDTVLNNQGADGGWTAERGYEIGGRAYTTALMVMSLTIAYQIVPIYQR